MRHGHLRKLCRTQTLPLAVRQYCDTMVEIGEWDQALMVAPSVSVAYWKVRCCQAAFVCPFAERNVMTRSKAWDFGMNLGGGGEPRMTYHALLLQRSEDCFLRRRRMSSNRSR